MSNPTIWQMTLPSGTTYDIEDKAARAAAAGINMVKCTQASDTPYGVKWMDGSTEITGTLAASNSTTGKFYLVPLESEDAKDVFAEYVTVITEGTPNTYSWEKIGTTDIDLSDLGDLAYKDSASGNFTPQGSIEVNASSGSGTAYTPEGSIEVNAATGSGTEYTPEGSVAAPTISVSSEGSTASITPFGSQGTLPSLTMSVSEGNLTISFSQGTLPTAGESVTVKTGDASYEASAPAFTGTKKKLAFSGTQKKLAFSGTQGSVTVS